MNYSRVDTNVKKLMDVRIRGVADAKAAPLSLLVEGK